MSEITQDRGRHAAKPTEIPRKGWRDVLLRTKSEMAADHVSVVSAGVAFFGLLALFPAIAATISIAGLLIDPATMQERIATLAAGLPEDAASILTKQATSVASNDKAGGIAAVIGLLLALYSASKGMKTLMEGMNIAYDEVEDRGFVMVNVTALSLTIFLVIGLILGLSATIVLPATMAYLGLPGWIETLATILSWVLLAVLTVVGLAVLYRFGPSRAAPMWRWVTPGAALATVLWLLGSAAFSIYVANFGSYGETYGALGGIIILLTWLWLSSFIVLMGAELNSEMEHQTQRDSTTGMQQPMGERGAVKADTVGKVP